MDHGQSHAPSDTPPLDVPGAYKNRGVAVAFDVRSHEELHALAKGLLEYETLSADEIRRIIRGERIVREGATGPVPDEMRSGRRSSVPPSGRPAGLEPEPQPGS